MTADNLIRLEKEAEKAGCTLLHNAELKNYTSFKIGGKVPFLAELDSVEKCVKVIPFAKKYDIPFYVIGKGSNIIADDKGVNAAVFRICGGDISLEDESTLVCYAGVPLVRLCTFALENSLTGLEFAYGIPGSVGGGVYMNAGAYGGEIKDVLVSVTAMDTDGNVHTYNADELDLSYRHSRFMASGEIVLSAKLKLKKGDKADIKKAMDDVMEKRRLKQPLEYPSAGSTFKRPEGSYASLLIDQCGLKGLSVGNAEVSEKHSGFIINKGGATFDDLMALIDKVKDIVKEKTGYDLECEPVIISDRKEKQG
jgi:UDP-N-acetylmuramate dehydrogenase